MESSGALGLVAVASGILAAGSWAMIRRHVWRALGDRGDPAEGALVLLEEYRLLVDLGRVPPVWGRLLVLAVVAFGVVLLFLLTGLRGG